MYGLRKRCFLSDKHTSYFETTLRLEENCERVIDFKKRLESSNNFAWKALSEIQNVLEALKSEDSEVTPESRSEILQNTIIALEEVSEQHKTLVGHSVRDLTITSKEIADDLNSVEAMSQEKESLEFRKEFEAIGKLVALEFRKPSTELDEAEELQQLMVKYNAELVKAG